ncbi:hypothetical protein [Stutzerimonas stutzeri]|uniref:hypothetical protein n=1 Tax=Stutzerimonas stutzeri TaxID=316 RepID=UPI00210CA9F1|nr:hypothetical protein [Stutzerimonas stutzeri]MCQ4256622.1 hypothetical protein [Stutzerimonas stutzeri]
MRSYLTLALGATILAIASTPASAGSIGPSELQLTQNSGAADRGGGNGSMGIGDGVDRLPERLDEKRDSRDEQEDGAYDQSGHGDTDPDMEHRPRRTLGDRDDD